jgi:HEAT repeat protein
MTDIDNHLTEHSGKLDDPDDQVRKNAAAQLGDLFEHLLVGRTAVGALACRSAVENMLRAALVEQNVDIQENILSAMVDAAALPPCKNVDWRSLAQALPSLDSRLIEYVLQILAFTHDPQYESAIQQFCSHTDLLIRQVAEESLEELHGKPPD